MIQVYPYALEVEKGKRPTCGTSGKSIQLMVRTRENRVQSKLRTEGTCSLTTFTFITPTLHPNSYSENTKGNRENQFTFLDFYGNLIMGFYIYGHDVHNDQRIEEAGYAADRDFHRTSTNLRPG